MRLKISGHKNTGRSGAGEDDPWVWNWKRSREKPWPSGYGWSFEKKILQKMVFREAGSLWVQPESSQGHPEVGQVGHAGP